MHPLVRFLATGAYTGYVPVAPGTAGSIVGVIIGEVVFAPIWARSPSIFLLLFALLFVGGCVVAGQAERETGKHDDSQIVIDEVFGMIAAMFLIPGRWPRLIVAFLLFRAFDVIKPWPANYFDSMHGGGGIMLDDLISGLYANLAVHLVRQII